MGGGGGGVREHGGVESADGASARGKGWNEDNWGVVVGGGGEIQAKIASIQIKQKILKNHYKRPKDSIDPITMHTKCEA